MLAEKFADSTAAGPGILHVYCVHYILLAAAPGSTNIVITAILRVLDVFYFSFSTRFDNTTILDVQFSNFPRPPIHRSLIIQLRKTEYRAVGECYSHRPPNVYTARENASTTNITIAPQSYYIDIYKSFPRRSPLWYRRRIFPEKLWLLHSCAREWFVCVCVCVSNFCAF